MLVDLRSYYAAQQIQREPLPVRDTNIKFVKIVNKLPFH